MSVALIVFVIVEVTSLLIFKSTLNKSSSLELEGDEEISLRLHVSTYGIIFITTNAKASLMRSFNAGARSRVSIGGRDSSPFVRQRNAERASISFIIAEVDKLSDIVCVIDGWFSGLLIGEPMLPR